MIRSLLLLALTVFLANSSPPLLGQTDRDQSARARTTDADVTYGRIKELVPGEKVVIDVDNAPDKTFDLADKDVTVKLATGLKVGDTVRLNEQEVAGKTKSVTISKHTGGGVKLGDKDPAAKKP
jgi:hypothetical protein